MVTRAAGYHAGFNFGFNVAEAVNFALPRWVLEVCRTVGTCKCNADSVKINMNRFLNNLATKAGAGDLLKDAPASGEPLAVAGAGAQETTDESS